MVAQKIEAFRNFASQLASQVTDQLCHEYEREVSQMWNELVMYRTELERVEQLLGAQLEREKKLHGVIEEMVAHSSNLNDHTNHLATQQPGKNDQLHNFLDHFTGRHSDILQQTLNGVGQANQVLSSQAAHANNMKQESVTAEHEFERIANLLQQPIESIQAPRPLVSTVPSSGRVVSSPMLGSPMRSMTPPRSPISPSFVRSPAPQHAPYHAATPTLRAPTHQSVIPGSIIPGAHM